MSDLRSTINAPEVRAEVRNLVMDQLMFVADDGWDVFFEYSQWWARAWGPDWQITWSVVDGARGLELEVLEGELGPPRRRSRGSLFDPDGEAADRAADRHFAYLFRSPR